MFKATLTYSSEDGTLIIQKPSMFSAVQEVSVQVSDHAEKGIEFSKVVIEEGTFLESEEQ
jgi:hypothetical protein